MSEKKLRFETLQIHGGYAPDHTLSRGLAIYPTAAYHFKTCDYAANLFELSEAGNIAIQPTTPIISSGFFFFKALNLPRSDSAFNSACSLIAQVLTIIISALSNEAV